MNPIMFGSRERQLFGVHLPAHGARRRQGVVICQSWGQEYERAHRACRLLAERMAQTGYDVIRFDYFGAGDSAGPAEEFSLGGCIQDAVAAADEIRALAAIRRVSFVGHRLGAIVADRAAALVRGADRLILWDPVAAGREWVGELNDSDTEHHLRGYPVSSTFRDELGRLQPACFTGGNTRELLLVVSEPLTLHDELAAHLRGVHDAVSFDRVPAARCWTQEADLGAGAVPVEVLEHITEWSG